MSSTSFKPVTNENTMASPPQDQTESGSSSAHHSSAVYPATPMKMMRMRSDTVGSTGTTFSSPALATVPHNTPMSRSVAGDITEANKSVDPNKLGSSLEAIEEHHNDAMSLDFSDPPTIPGNTPFHSPPPSYYSVAARDVSGLTTRLANMGYATSPLTSPRSMTPPLSPRLNPSQSSEVGVINVALGSPRKWSPVQGMSSPAGPGLAPGKPNVSPSSVAVHLDDIEQACLKSICLNSITEQRPIPSVEVHEAQDWSALILDDVEHALARLENLAHDDFRKNDGFSQLEHYKRRLMSVVARPGRLNPFADETRLADIEANIIREIKSLNKDQTE